MTSLGPGTRLGPYEVVAQIGVGGMGEVYKATDTNLKRAVAIKVLPVSVAGDAERLARFPAELKAALGRARGKTADGKPCLIDVEVARHGPGWTDDPWVRTRA